MSSLNIDALWFLYFFFSSRRRHTRCLSDWSSDVCSSDLSHVEPLVRAVRAAGNANVTTAHQNTDHSWSDKRIALEAAVLSRSEERRVGKECRSRCAPYH